MIGLTLKVNRHPFNVQRALTLGHIIITVISSYLAICSFVSHQWKIAPCCGTFGTRQQPLTFPIWSGLLGITSWSWMHAFGMTLSETPPTPPNSAPFSLLISFLSFPSHNSRDRLADLVAEHLDHLHYLNDILCLDIHALNDVLTDHLLNRLLIPLYVYSLTQSKAYEQRSVSCFSPFCQPVLISVSVIL